MITHIWTFAQPFQGSMCLQQKFITCRLNQVKGEHITIELWCLKCFICMDLSDEQGAFDGLWKITICSFTGFWINSRNQIYFSLALFSRNSQCKKKTYQQLYLIKWFKDVIYLFRCQGHLKHFFGKLCILSKIWKWHM